MPSTAWTVIPRGITKTDGGDVLTFGIFVSPMQLIPGQPPNAHIQDTLNLVLDGHNGTDMWLNWYTNRQNDLLSPNYKGLKLLLNGDAAHPSDVTIVPAKNAAVNYSSMWNQLVCYAQPDWNKQTYAAPLPNNTTTAPACSPAASRATAAHGPSSVDEPEVDDETFFTPPSAPSRNSISDIYTQASDGITTPLTTPLANLHSHASTTRAAGTVWHMAMAMQQQVATGRPAGRNMSTTAMAALDATMHASQQNLDKGAKDLVILKTPDPNGISATAKGARDMIANLLQSNDPATRTAGLTLQRNLYRLSDDPFYRLVDEVFPIVERLSLPKNLQSNDLQNIDVGGRKAIFINHAIFHRRCSSPQLGQSDFTKLQPTPPVASCGGTTLATLYRTLAMLGRHPEWLERLGFAYTAKVTLPSGLKLNQVQLTSIPPSAAKRTDDPAQPLLTPTAMVTACTEDGFPQVLSDDAQDGSTFDYSANLLLLGDECALVESDVDGESLRLLQQANSASLAVTAAKAATIMAANSADASAFTDADPPDTWTTSPTDPNAPLPTRTSGITLIHADRPSHQMATLNGQLGLRRDPNQPLGLRDLIKGYSPEIQDGGDWISLTCRNVTYKGEKDPITQPYVAVHLEAAVHNDTPSLNGDGNVSDLHMPQTMFRWTGWNLTVPLPFAVADQTKTQPNCAPSFPISAEYQALDGSLPRLRLGRTYSLRVRLLDLTGNVLPVGTEAPNAKEPPSLKYLRHDAIPAPELLMEADWKKGKDGEMFTQLGQGETFMTVVRREDDGDVLRRRCVAPPTGNIMLLIEHGMLDDNSIFGGSNGFKDLDDFGSFHDVEIDATSGDFPSGLLQFGGGQHCVPMYVRPQGDLPPGTYLPDPMAFSLKAEIVDLLTGNVYWNFPAASFYDDDHQWPNARRLRVQMDAATGDKPHLRWETSVIDRVHTLMVSVPVGWHVKVRLHCIPDDGQANYLAAENVHEQFGPGLLEELQKINAHTQLPSVAEVRRSLLNGELPHYTPSLDLDFIYAVERPLMGTSISCTSVDGKLKAVQQYDSAIATFINIVATIGDRRTTGKIELIAAWDDPNDNSLDHAKGANPKHTSAELASYHLGLGPLKDASQPNSQNKIPRSNAQKFSSVTHTFPDTRCRKLILSVNSVSRYGQYYEDNAEADEQRYTTPGSNTTEVILCSTSRPAAPRVVKIIPLLPVSRSHEHHKHMVSRAGGAFRVYLDRPWYSSGFGEMLGVVLWGQALEGSSAHAALEPFVTRWAADPSRIGAVDSTAPMLANFKAPVNADGTLAEGSMGLDGKLMPLPMLVPCVFPAEMLVGKDDTNPANISPQNTPFVSIAAYPVKYQDRTQLYYADIQIDKLPAYNTFIRLALTSYQPNSLPNRECSSIVVAGFAQLLEDRCLILNSLSSGMMRLDIIGIQATPNLTQSGNTFHLRLEYQDDGRWIPTRSQPQITNCDGQSDATCISFTFENQHRSKARRLIVEEYEQWFADDPQNISLRVMRAVPRPSQLVHLPHWD